MQGRPYLKKTAPHNSKRLDSNSAWVQNGADGWIVAAPFKRLACPCARLPSRRDTRSSCLVARASPSGDQLRASFWLLQHDKNCMRNMLHPTYISPR